MPGLAPPAADERTQLLDYLAQQRLVLRLSAYGLTDAQARSVPSVSALSVGGIIKHVAATERYWIDTVVLGHPSDLGGSSSYGDNFEVGPDETLDDVLATYSEVAVATAGAVDAVGDLDHAVPVPRDSLWLPKDIEEWPLRWVLLHIVEETARHAGHADIVREHIDGATAFALMAAAEGWPETPWLTPWKAPA